MGVTEAYLKMADDEAADKDGYGVEPECLVAVLLAEDVVFLNTNWSHKDWPEEAQKSWRVIVNCNDVFMWGCADGEYADYDDIAEIYRIWRKDPRWGPAMWCIRRRKLMPQPPVEKAIRKEAIWDLDAEEGLAINPAKKTA